MVSVLPLFDSATQPDRIMLPARSIQDQGDIDACFSCAISSALEARAPQVPPLSPSFHFHYSSGGEPVEGMTAETAFDTLRHNGIASHQVHQFAITRAGIAASPSTAADMDAEQRRLKLAPPRGGFDGYVPVYSMFQSRIRKFLEDGAAVVAMLYTNEAYWRMSAKLHPHEPPRDRLANVDNLSSQIHVVCILGLIEREGCFVVQDSHGKTFGRAGQWLLPYGFVDSYLLQSAYGFYSQKI